jgi:hypothetical protein
VSDLTHKWPTQRECREFYGNPRLLKFERNNIVTVTCPWKLVYEGGPVRNNGIRIHKKCADSLSRVLLRVWDNFSHDQAEIEKQHCHLFSGSFVVRSIRGGLGLSTHSYGAAIDWDDEHNEHHSKQHFFTAEHPLIAQFLAEGWIWGGNWPWPGIDAMHIQAARVS